jgi:hypothetical protein
VLVTVPKIKEDDDKSADVDEVDSELLRPQPEKQTTNNINIVKIHARRPIYDGSI